MGGAMADVLFGSALYNDVGTPGTPRRPGRMDNAPDKASLTGILKYVVKAAGDADCRFHDANPSYDS